MSLEERFEQLEASVVRWKRCTALLLVLLGIVSVRGYVLIESKPLYGQESEDGNVDRQLKVSRLVVGELIADSVTANSMTGEKVFGKSIGAGWIDVISGKRKAISMFPSGNESEDGGVIVVAGGDDGGMAIISAQGASPFLTLNNRHTESTFSPGEWTISKLPSELERKHRKENATQPDPLNPHVYRKSIVSIRHQENQGGLVQVFNAHHQFAATVYSTLTNEGGVELHDVHGDAVKSIRASQR